MYNEGLEYLNKLNKNLAGPLTELNKAAVEVMHKAAQQHIEIASENIARLSEQVKRAGKVKKPEEIIDLQKEYLNENISAAVDNMQKILQMNIQHIEELTKTCSKCAKPLAEENVKQTKANK